MKLPLRCLCLAALLLSTIRPLPAAPPDTAFTYQGQLKQSGTAATGSYDFQFSLYPEASGGGQMGSTLELRAISVSGGVFTTQLDFEINPFIDGARWLEIAVRPAGGGAYTTLSPRQELTATPYALRAKLADQASYAASAGSAPIPAGSITADKLAPGATATTVTTSAATVTAAANTTYDGTNWVEVIGSLARKNQPNTFSAANTFNGNTTFNATNTFNEANLFNGRVTILDPTSDHDLRVTDGTSKGNWHLQALGGGNSGYGTLGWNGFWNTTAPFLYNTSKALWRMNVDQRGGSDYFALDAWDGSTFREAWRADAATGQMGLGKSPDAGFRLDVNGLIRTIGAVNTSSDRRFKEDIQPLTGALEKVSRLTGVSYDWNRTAFPDKHFSDRRQIGFIAQDVQTVLPELVTADSEGYLSVAYTAAVPVLVEAVKEQQQQMKEQRQLVDEQQQQMKEQRQLVDEQQQQVEALRAENAGLKARLERIEQRLTQPPVATAPVAGRSEAATISDPAPPSF